MPTIDEQKDRIESIRTAQYITGALRDISAIEMRAYRERFEQNGGLYDELRWLYGLIQRIASHEGYERAVARTKADTLFVAYTTNKHFYGTINEDTMREFKKQTDAKARCLIIGDTGKQFWLQAGAKRLETAYMSFDDDMPSEQETRDFLQQVAAYGRVFIFYPGFESAFTQRPAMLDITFSEQSKVEHETAQEELPNYILEPEIVQMFDFFDTQVRYVLFERLLLETQLSRVAARLLKMDTADQNAQQLLKVEGRELHRLRASMASTRMLETISGYIQWHKREHNTVR